MNHSRISNAAATACLATMLAVAQFISGSVPAMDAGSGPIIQADSTPGAPAEPDDRGRGGVGSEARPGDGAQRIALPVRHVPTAPVSLGLRPGYPPGIEYPPKSIA